MSSKVRFLDFTVDTQSHQLRQMGKRIDIASSAYKLLIYFIENPGITISRQTLIDYIWSNRIVSETSLDKLIQRLRKILGDTGTHKDIIGTVHGEGFVFLPEIKTELAVKSVLSKNHPKSKYKYIFIISALILLVYFANNEVDNKDDLKIISQAEANPVMLALIPDVFSLKLSNQKWMTQGGMHYLNAKFKAVHSIKSKRISLRKLGDFKPEHYAIKLSNSKAIDSSLIVRVREKNQDFVADVQLRTITGQVFDITLHSAAIKSLYDSVYDWTLEKLNIQSTSEAKTFENTMSDNRYAVENYMRGVSSQLGGDAQQAIKYFELAIDEDAQFWLAWYQLSVSYRKQGEYAKAMSIVKVFENISLEDEFSLKVINSRVNIHNAMGEFKESINAADTGIALAQNMKNINGEAILLSNKAYAASQSDQHELALESIEKSIELTHKINSKDNDGLGRAYSTLAGIQRNMGNINAAQVSTMKAINYISKTDNKRYSAKLKLRLSSIVAKKGEWQKAENLVKDAVVVLSELDAVLEASTAYMRLIDFQLIIGKFEKAQKNYSVLSEMMNTISSKDQLNYFLISKIDFLLHIEQLDQVKSALKELKLSTINDYHLMNYYLLTLRYFSKINDTKNWKKTAKEFIEIKSFVDNPLVHLTQAQLAKKEKNYDLAINAFEQAKKFAISMNSIRVVSVVLNSYIEFLLNQNKLKLAQTVLFELEKFNVPKYPYLKNKARLLFAQNKAFESLTLLEELKEMSGGLWNVADQLLLEKYQKNQKL